MALLPYQPRKKPLRTTICRRVGNGGSGGGDLCPPRGWRRDAFTRRCVTIFPVWLQRNLPRARGLNVSFSGISLSRWCYSRETVTPAGTENKLQPSRVSVVFDRKPVSFTVRKQYFLFVFGAELLLPQNLPRAVSLVFYDTRYRNEKFPLTEDRFGDVFLCFASVDHHKIRQRPLFMRQTAR